MAYPIPPDPRATDDFDVVRGWETMDRRDLVFSDTTAAALSADLGEPLRFLSGTDGVVKCDGVGDYIVGTNVGEQTAGVSWTNYEATFEDGGYPDALKTGLVTVLQGKFSCKFNDSTTHVYFLAAGAFDGITMVAPTVGCDVVAVYDHGVGAKYGCLSSDPAVRYAVGPTAAQVLADRAVIGKVSEVSGNYVTVDFNV